MNGMKARGVMFDWDGVLLDSLGAAFNVYNKIFAGLGTKALTKDEFLRLQSPNWYDFYIKAGIPEAQWNQVDEQWLRLYEEERPDLQPDAVGCLERLRKEGFRLALVSNGSKGRVEREVAEFKLAMFFDSVLCGERKEELKPSPAMLEKTLVALRLDPAGAFYVGDSPADIQASKNAGVPSIAIARGPIQEERLRAENPDHVFPGLRGMTDFLLGRR
jgi:HAD superfamily hydrolase (TIGR01662 family)